MGDYKPHTAEMKNGGGALKAPTKRTYFSKACSLLVTLTLAVGLCPSVALASPEVDPADTTPGKPVVEQPADPSTTPTEQAPEPPAEEPPAPDEPSDNPNPSDTPESQLPTAPDAVEQPAPDAKTDEPEQATEPEVAPDTSEEPAADTLDSYTKTTTIDGVTYTYYIGVEYSAFGPGVYIEDTTWAPSITIPAQIEGEDVVYFHTNLGHEIQDTYRLDASKAVSLVRLDAVSSLSSIDVSNNAALETLDISGGFLTELDVSKCKNLEALWCESNMLTKLDVSANKKLEDLNCSLNRISDTKTLTDRFGKDEYVVLPQYAYAPSLRFAGDTALDTMREISQFFPSDTAIVATMEGYWDALTASSLAGLDHCPILLTDGSTLSKQTSWCINYLRTTNVFIVGGPAAVSKGVENSLKKLSSVKTVTRLAGDTAIDTALKIYEKGKGSWSTTAIVATSGTFQDALSVSPYAYAKRAPIFLANASTHKLDPNTLSAIKAGGFKQIVIVGGTSALSDQIEKQQLKGMSCKRLSGPTAYETSAAIATWCLTQGMTAARVGVATGSSYYDALAGAALCGRNNSALVLVEDGYYSSIKSFIAPNKDSIKELYVFGGPAAVSPKTCDAITAALK